MSVFLMMSLVPFFIWQPDGLLSYQNPSDVSDSYLAQPHGIAFDAKGRLFAVDAKQGRIFFWDAKGSFIGTFAKKGQGPGELQFPTCITAARDQIWVTDGSQKMHIFSNRGAFIKAIPIQVHARVLKAAGPGKAIIGARVLNPRANRNDMVFQVLDVPTQELTEIKRWHNETVMNIEDGKWRWKAFGDDIDAQMLDDGTVVFGFSGDRQLYKWDAKKGSSPWLKVDVPQGEPTKAEQAFIKDMSFPGNGGSRFKLDKNTSWLWDFSQAKAPYTHFLIRGDKVLFVLMPLGSIQGVGGGYAKGTYAVVDRGDGQVVARGKFEFPEDSLVFLEDGHILGFLINAAGDFEIKGLALDGF